MPDYLTDDEVATLPCAELTAWRAMFVDARLKPGDTVVLQRTAAFRSSVCNSRRRPG